MDSEADVDLSPQDSDYDGAWKEALRLHLPDFLAKFFAAVHAAIDWNAPLEWRDKELSQILGQAGSRNRRVDLLAKVSLLSGEPQWILLHLEIQSSSEPEFAQRIALYNSGLFWTLQQRVVTLAVLADLAPEWRPCEDRFQLADFESCLRFPICKLVEKLEGEWREDLSLPVQVARAQIAALRTAGDPEGRFRAKRQLVHSLYQAGYNSEQLRELFRLIDWMMHLRSDWEARFRADLAAYEERTQMPYITSVERLAKAEGKAEGKAEAGVGILLRLLGRSCGPLPEDVTARIGRLSYPEIENLSEAVLAFRTTEDVRRWLDANTAKPTPE